MDLDALACILRGYLQALRRVSSNRCDFWTCIVDWEGGNEGCIESLVADTDIRFSGRAFAGYAEVDALHALEFPRLRIGIADIWITRDAMSAPRRSRKAGTGSRYSAHGLALSTPG